MKSGRTLQVLVVEDEALFRELISHSLVQHGFQVVGATGDVLEALEMAKSFKPDVVLLDIHLGTQAPDAPQNGVQLALKLRQTMPQLGVVFLSNHRELEFLRAFETGSGQGWSYLLKKNIRSISALTRAIEGASEGMVVLDSELMFGTTRRGKLAELTDRQFEVLSLVAQGFSNAAIAEQLGISVRTIDNQTSSLYTALGVNIEDSSVQPRVRAVLTYLSETRRTV